MLMAIFSRRSTLVNAMLVNWLPWSVLNISGAPKRASASSNASMQKSVSSVIDSRHDKTADSYLGFIHLVSIRLWMREFVNAS